MAAPDAVTPSPDGYKIPKDKLTPPFTLTTKMF